MFPIRDIDGIFSVANFGSNPPSIITERFLTTYDFVNFLGWPEFTI